MASGTHTTTGLLPATPRERLGLLGTQQARRSLLPSGPGHAPGPLTLAAIRARIADTVEAGIALLDEIDGDPDFEVMHADDEDTHDLETVNEDATDDAEAFA